MDTLGTKLAKLRGNKSDRQIVEEIQAAGLLQDYTPTALRKLLNLWENGNRTPAFASLVALADFYGVTTDYLLGRQDIEYNYDSAEAVADVLGLKREAAENLLKLSITDGGAIAFSVLSDFLLSDNFNRVMAELKKSKDGISRQLRYFEKELPAGFKVQCEDMADMYIVNAHKALDILLKDTLGYNELMKEVGK